MDRVFCRVHIKIRNVYIDKVYIDRVYMLHSRRARLNGLIYKQSSDGIFTSYECTRDSYFMIAGIRTWAFTSL